MQKKTKIIIALGVLATAVIAGIMIWKKKKSAGEVIIDENGVVTPAKTATPATTAAKPATTVAAGVAAAQPATAVSGGVYAYGSVQKESDAKPYAKFILTKQVPGFKPGDSITITGGAYAGKTSTITYVYNNQHLMTTIPFTATSSGTLTKK